MKFSDNKSDLRLIFFFIAIILVETSSAQEFIPPAPIHTPTDVKVNRTIPKNALASDEQIIIHFSTEPTDEEIYQAHFFEEPLVPMDGTKNGKENTDLVNALVRFRQRHNSDDFSALTEFLKLYPESRWRGALLTNIGLVYRSAGYFTAAINSWREAWDLMKDQQEPKVRGLADRAIVELISIYGWVGEYQKMESLLSEIDDRILHGPATERIVSAREVVSDMKNHPAASFKCGPAALNNIIKARDHTKSFNEELWKIKSPRTGFSLFDLQQMAKKVGLDYQMAFRKPGAQIILNSVVHWKLNHYSAILSKEKNFYRCEDPTLGTMQGQQICLTEAALDEEASGYFLVPAGPLPKGWRTVSPDEASNIFGKGSAPAPVKNLSNEDDQVPECPKIPETPGMAQCNVHAAAVSLHIADRPVYYVPPVGPAVMWDVQYHQRDSYQPVNFNYTSYGPKWTCDWLSYISMNIPDANDVIPLAGTSTNSYSDGGSAMGFANFNTVTQSFAPQLQTDDVLIHISGDCWEMRHPDGSKEVFSRSDGGVPIRKIFMTQKIDPAGNSVNVLYDANFRVIGLQDAIGQVTTISYDNPDIYKITKVTDPFGRFATFEYDSVGRLSKITDEMGMTSQFKYDAGDFVVAMITPYGTTSFVKEETPDGHYRALEITYPLDEKIRVEYKEQAPGIPSSESIVPDSMPTLFNQYINYRNTFYWDRKAMKEGAGDYTKARIFHWTHGNTAISDESESASGIRESIKNPLENRVWYSHQNQPDAAIAVEGMSSEPNIIGRVLDDSTTQLWKYSYNVAGSVTSVTDPVGRQFTFAYDTNNIDLLEVRQTANGANELLAKYTYNSQHLPLTSTDAAGQTTTYTYNGAGQLLTITNPKHETITLIYNNSYLQSVTGAIPGSSYGFTYDGYGRIKTVTDPGGYMLTIDYDALNRPTVVTFPDGTYQQTVYDRLDAVHTRDRLGRWSHAVYDSLDRPNIIQDALGRITQFIWCDCGSLEEIIDPLKQITSFTRDLQGRATSKAYNDGKTISYKYENTTSRLKEITDPKGQKTDYQYFPDNNLKQVDYNNAAITTPSVSYTYDSKYNQIASMTDGTGTTIYSYNPINSTPTLGAGQLATIDGPLTNDVISYSYDSLGRISSRAINGVAASSVYDALDRITSAANALGTFTYSYVNQTNDLSSINMPNGQITAFLYFDNLGDRRLKEIWNKKSGGGTLSKFDYEYNHEGQITKWTKQTGSSTPSFYELDYDLADQLSAATLKDQATNNILKLYSYQYDPAGNRTSEQVDNVINSFVHNQVNQLTSEAEGGPMKFKGTLDEFSSVTVSNPATSSTATASVDTNNVFEASVKVRPGLDTVTVTAKDYSGNNNTTTSKYKITIGSGINQTFTYDDNANLTNIQNSTSNTQYDWDAVDRLVKITRGTNVTEFIYDGLSRRVAEKLNGLIIKRWIWCGTELCEERDASGSTVTKRFFPQGEQISGVNYFFTRDHLGSIRELMGSNGTTIKARYDYDPYGRRTLISGTDLADFGFTGHYFHKSSGLHLALCRAYDANFGRWLNRDPIAEAGGSNLFSYALSDPINFIDPLGLAGFPFWNWPGWENLRDSKNLNEQQCMELEKLVEELTNHLDIKEKAMKADVGDIYLGRSPQNGTWSGHQSSYKNDQQHLKDFIKNLDDENNNCRNKSSAKQRNQAETDPPLKPDWAMKQEQEPPTSGLVEFFRGFMAVGVVVGEAIGVGVAAATSF